MSDYRELRCQSAFSFLRAASLPEDLAEEAARLGYESLALGDRDGVYGAPRFFQAARRLGLRPLVGAHLTLEGAPGDEPVLYVLVENREGYRNLCRLLTQAKLRAPKGEARVAWSDLEPHASGLLCLAGGAEGPLVTAARQGPAAVRAVLERLRALFPDRLWIDLQRHFDLREERRNGFLADLAAAEGIPLVATNDVRHARRPERALLDVLQCIREKTTLEAAGRRLLANAERHLKPPATMTELFRDFPRAVRETRAIAERCEFTLADLGYRFPEPPLGPGETADGTLRRRVFEGARRRWPQITPRIASQLEHELGIISRLGLAGYFLVVHDIVEFCRREGILAQGRGSAANSAVCYALGITAIDAVAMDLLFERFLSEERGEWPDIDIDLPSGEQRERVIQYVYSRYGPHGAAMTADVITYRVRSAVREVGRVLGLDPRTLDRLSRSLAAHGFVDDHDRIASQIRRAGLDPSSGRVRQFVRLVEAIQGLPRHLGQHSGGMVLSAGRLDEVVPLEPARMPGRIVIQWDKDDCADLGIIKVDLLGLGMMAVLEEAIPLVREHEGVEIDLARLPPDDPEVYARLRQADTIGVFQVESRAQMATLPRLKPERFYDLVVEVAIIRPGPIVGDMVHPYLARRAGREPVTYDHPLLEPILRRTLGVPLFQEQLLRMAVAVAGFTPGEAEELRRAMGFKRSIERMRALEQRLREGMARNGIVGETARRILKSITSFALYGFPESHAASFALLAYASAYLKVHHGAAFTCALLDHWPMGFYHPATIVQDARRHGIPVLPVDVARSAWRCTLERTEDGRLGVRLGLRYVRGLREAAGRRIEEERPFRSPGDLARRCALARDDLERLAHAGALASFGLSRRDALWQVAAIEQEPNGLFAATEPASPETSPLPPLSPLEETLADYAATGLTTGEHVLRHLRPALAARGVLSSAELHRAGDRQRVKIAGHVIVRQRPATAKGFLFLTLEDEHGTANVVVTPRAFERERLLLHTAPILLVEGEVQRVDGVIHVRGRRFEALSLPGATPESHDFR